jgi:hypothetical protein
MLKIIFPLFIALLLLICGCAILTITADLENPLLITLTWNGETLETDPATGKLPGQILDTDGAVVRASITDEYGNPVIPESYEWYLKGEFYEDGDTILLDNTMGIGVYWLDIIVKNDTILSSEQVEFVILE